MPPSTELGKILAGSAKASPAVLDRQVAPDDYTLTVRAISGRTGYTLRVTIQ